MPQTPASTKDVKSLVLVLLKGPAHLSDGHLWKSPEAVEVLVGVTTGHSVSGAGW